MQKKIDDIKRAHNAKQFEPYINHIRFFNYKNVEDTAKIDFNFPITILVGPNGSNKSSIIKALRSCPLGNSLEKYWFSTEVDVIAEDEKGDNPARIIYSYYDNHSKKYVEATKAMIKKDGKPEYWEPTRPVKKCLMEAISEKDLESPACSKTRWKQIEKEAVYLDFRAEIGAYDKYFYFGELNVTKTIKSKQDRIRDWSKDLKKIIIGDEKSYVKRKKERLIENTILEKKLCKEISNILGVEYSEIRYIEHSLYDNSIGVTILMKKVGMEYSEAFAGSGETAVIMLVKKIMEAKEKSLILLDEPETSLHPGAQSKLMLFLFAECLNKKHQIVISTHSPILIYGLPAIAIKSFIPIDNKVSFQNSTLPEEAFYRIGYFDVKKTIVYVEDIFVKVFLEWIVEKHLSNLVDTLEFNIFPGGSETIIKKLIVSSAIAKKNNEFYYLDGDVQKIDENGNVFLMPDVDELAPNDYNEIDNIIKKVIGCNLEIPVNGNAGKSNVAHGIELKKDFIRYWNEKVAFLPGKTPEELVISLIKDTSTDDDVKKIKEIASQETNFKQIFLKYTKYDLDVKDDCSVKSDDILNSQKRILKKIDTDKKELQDIINQLKKFISENNYVGD